MKTFTAPIRRTRNPFARIAAGIIAALALTVSAAAPALAHDQLVGSSAEATSDGSGVELTLSFNNELINEGAAFVITDDSGADLLDGSPIVSGRDLVQRIVMPPFGEHVTVQWRAVSSDGHPINGELDLVGKDLGDGNSEWSLTPAEADHHHDEEEAGSGGSEGHQHESDSSDAPADNEEADVVTTQSENENSGVPVAIWVAIAVVLVLAIGGGTFATTRRKRAGQAAGDNAAGADDAGTEPGANEQP